MTAEVQRPAAVVRPLTCLRLVTMMVPAPMKPIPAMTCAPQAAHVGIKVHFQAEILAGQSGHCRAETDENMGAETGGTALIFPFQADNAAADHGQRQTHGHRQKTHIPDKIKA